MKIKTHKKITLKKVALIFIGAAIITGGTLGIMALTKTGPFKQQIQQQDSSDSNSQSDTASDLPQTDTPPTDTSTSPTPKTPVSNQPVDNGDTNTLKASITAANQNDNTLQIRTLIENVSSNGTCALKLTKGSSVVSRSAGIQALSSSSTCKGFDIPVSDLSTGQWLVTLTITIGAEKATLTKTISIT